MSVRLDKWLHVARVFKTRTQATHAVDLNRVRVNGQTAKPHRNLVLGDRIEVEIGEWTRVLIVKELKDKPVSKEEARTLFEDLSPPRPESDPIQRLMRRPRPCARREPAGPPRRSAGTSTAGRRASEEIEREEKGWTRRSHLRGKQPRSH